MVSLILFLKIIIFQIFILIKLHFEYTFQLLIKFHGNEHSLIIQDFPQNILN
jgi:hypothetical protein